MIATEILTYNKVASIPLLLANDFESGSLIMDTDH